MNGYAVNKIDIIVINNIFCAKIIDMATKISLEKYNKKFGLELKRLRFQSSLFTLHALSEELYKVTGLSIDPSLLSHWQRGARVPKNRQTVLALIKIFVNRQSIKNVEQGHAFCNLAEMGNLTENEIFEIFADSEYESGLNFKKSDHEKETIKAYFTAAIAQKEEYGKYYKNIVQSFSKAGYEIFEDTTKVSLDEAINKTDTQRTEYYQTVMNWIEACDVLICEVSFPSTLHIGHELTVALQKNKLVIAFYKKGKEPSFFLGLKDRRLVWIEYSDGNILEITEKTARITKNLI